MKLVDLTLHWLTVAFILFSLLIQGLAAQTVTLVLKGDVASDDNGVFDTFELPVLNAGGDVAFYSRLAETEGIGTGIGLFKIINGEIVQIVRDRCWRHGRTPILQLRG